MINKEELIKEYSQMAYKGEAALFVGAGISIPYGLPDFQGLIKELARGTIDLEITPELNYPQIAQFICNEKLGKKEIKYKISKKFDILYDENKSTYLRSIANSSISTIWTTNFDKLIEQSISFSGRNYDVRNEEEHFKYYSSRNNVEILKIHGDIISSDIVITQSDYEDFNINHRIAISRLEKDLLSKSFLFIGYSYKDPNIKTIVNTVKQLLNSKFVYKHYMILEQPKDTNESKLQKLWIKDMERYGIYVYEYQYGNYKELESILAKVSKKSKGRSVFVTGSHLNNHNTIAAEVGRELFHINNLILKYGHSKGIGSIVCNNFVQKCISNNVDIGKRIEIYANPYSFCDDWDNKDFLLGALEEMRKDILENVQILIAFPGGKGTKLEIEMALKRGVVVIPVMGERDKKFKEYIFKNLQLIEQLRQYSVEYINKLECNQVKVADIINCVRVILND